jgi:AcrR family transcriptional regulator
MTDRFSRLSQVPRGPEFHSVRDDLLAVAGTQFGHLGYEKTTVNDLAEAIGFSKAYVYKFFASKQAIGDAIADQRLSDIIAAVACSVDAATSPTQKFRACIATFEARTKDLRDLERKLYEIVCLAETSGWPSWRRYLSATEGIVRPIIVHGRELGEFERKTPLDEVCAGILAAVQPVLDPMMQLHAVEAEGREVGHLTGLILRSLAP